MGAGCQKPDCSREKFNLRSQKGDESMEKKHWRAWAGADAEEEMGREQVLLG